MFCQKCGKQIPDGAVFCNFCGGQQGVVAPSAQPQAPGYPPQGPPPGYPPQAPGGYPAPPPEPQHPAAYASAGTKDLKCSSCGAPLTPQSGLTLITCDYCGVATSLGTGGWSVIQKHFMLDNRIDQQVALETGGKWLDQGILRRNVSKNAELLEATLRYVPYWIVPTSVTADIQGLKGGGVSTMGTGQGAGTTAAKVGLSLLAGVAAAAAANQRGGRVVMNQPQPVRVRDRINVFYNIPVVGVRGYNKYQPDDGYTFNVQGKSSYDKKKTGGVETLDGDVAEQEAMQFAQSLAQKYAEKEARKRVDTLESFVPYFQQSPGELLHAPVWFVRYNHKGKKEMFILIDGNASKVIDGERPAASLW